MNGWGKLMPRASLHIAGRVRLILVSGIGSLWKPGGTLCPQCVPLGGGGGFIAFCWWDEDGHVGSLVGDSPGVFTQNWLLGIIGFCSDVIIWSLCQTDMAGCFDTEPGGLDVMKEDSGRIAMTTSVRSWGGDSEPYDWLHVLSKGVGPPIGGRFCTVMLFWSVGISYMMDGVHLAGISWGPPSDRVTSPCCSGLSPGRVK